MKSTSLILVMLLAGCGGEPFERPTIWKAPIEAGQETGQDPDADPPDSAPETGQDSPGETDPPDTQTQPEASPEAGPDAEPDAEPDTYPNQDSSPETEPAPDSCTPASCPSGAICGWIDDGCGSHKLCGSDYQRSEGMDAPCSLSAGQPYAWGCGSYGVGIPTSEPAPDAPGPEPMPGCIWSGKPNVTPPDLQTYAWCCPSETLPAH